MSSWRRCRSSTVRSGRPTCDIGHVSGERAAAELGWRAETPFTEGVRRYLDWLTVTSGSPVAAADASTDGSAATVLRQESAEL